MKFLVTLLIPGLAAAAIFPETLGPYQRASTGAPVLTDQAVWKEYGLKSSESADYQSGKEKFTATSYRLQDPTAALGAFDWQRPRDARPSNAADLAVETPKTLLLVHGNYLFSFQGYKPSAAELGPVLNSLRDVDSSPLPALPGFFPSDGLIPNSERYVIGPAALAKFAPSIPPSVAAFHLGAEAQLGVFHSPKGDMSLAVFNYPTPQIARQKEDEFRKLPQTVVKRSGPLVALMVAPPDPDAAEHVLAQVRYQAEITLHEPTPTSIQKAGRMIVNIFILTGILLVFCVIAGLFVGGFRVFLLRGRKGQPEDSMILLHLEQR
jgi:hypothetical protein